MADVWQNLRAYLASAGSTPEQIHAIEQAIAQSAYALGVSPSRVANDALTVLMDIGKPPLLIADTLDAMQMILRREA